MAKQIKTRIIYKKDTKAEQELANLKYRHFQIKEQLQEMSYRLYKMELELLDQRRGKDSPNDVYKSVDIGTLED